MLDTGNANAGQAKNARNNGPEGAALGSLAKTGDTPKKTRAQSRQELFRLQRHAAAILPRERVSKCRWTVADNSIGVRVVRREHEGEFRARFSGLQTCGSVWQCPICSRNVSETRRRELNEALAEARSQGMGVFLMTLTFQHNRGERLKPLLAALKDARKHFTQSRAWRNLKPNIAGTIAALEVTHGANGWHPHFHILLFTTGELTLERLMALHGLSDQWLASLRSFGRDGNGAAFDLDLTGNAAGSYVAKWGAAEELTLGSKKVGKGRNPWKLLEASQNGDRAARAAFEEYAHAFKGARQLTWTKGLKDLLRVTVLEDDQAADTSDETSFDASPETNHDELVAFLLREDWKHARKRGRPRLLEAAETPDSFDAYANLQAVIDGPELPHEE